MALTEIVVGVFMPGIMLAVAVLVLKLIKDTRTTMKTQNKLEDSVSKQDMKPINCSLLPRL